MALALEADHLRKGSKAATDRQELCPILNWKLSTPCTACAGAHPINETPHGARVLAPIQQRPEGIEAR